MMGDGRLIEVNTLLESDSKGEHNRMLDWGEHNRMLDWDEHNQMLLGQLSTTECSER
jgi:hypothetical protein